MDNKENKNWILWEDNDEKDTIESFIKSNNDIKNGDTIEYITFNQEGYKKYKIIIENNEKKNIDITDEVLYEINLTNKTNYDYEVEN